MAIILTGPTASGKTKLALTLATRLPVEIISVDATLIYRGFDIGSGKPTPSELNSVPHHLIDILEPEQSYSVARFCQDAHTIASDIKARGKIPLFVGGTMMYIHAMLHGLSKLPDSKPEIRAELEQELDSQGVLFLHKKLAQIDPQAAARLKPQDKQRILRALEVHVISGKTLTELQQNKTNIFAGWDFACIALSVTDRAKLHQNIALRFEQMLLAGFVQEVETLIQRPELTSEHASMRCVGYRQIYNYLQGQIDYEQMQAQAIAATRQLAKRQLTWLRSFKDFKQIDFMASDLVNRINNFLEKNKAVVSQ